MKRVIGIIVAVLLTLTFCMPVCAEESQLSDELAYDNETDMPQLQPELIVDDELDESDQRALRIVTERSKTQILELRVVNNPYGDGMDYLQLDWWTGESFNKTSGEYAYKVVINGGTWDEGKKRYRDWCAYCEHGFIINSVYDPFFSANRKTLENGINTIELYSDGKKVFDGTIDLSITYVETDEGGYKSRYGKDFKLNSYRLVVYTSDNYGGVYSMDSVELPFEDVTFHDWFYEPVKYVYNKKYMSGVSKNKFDPKATTTRAMMAQILYNIAGKPDVKGKTNPFADAQSGWYKDAITYVYSNKITNGKSAQLYGVNDQIRREDIAVLLYRDAVRRGIDMTVPKQFEEIYYFPADRANISGYAAEAVKWACYRAIMAGNEINGKKYLRPKDNATRAEIASMVMHYSADVLEENK